MKNKKNTNRYPSNGPKTHVQAQYYNGEITAKEFLYYCQHGRMPEVDKLKEDVPAPEPEKKTIILSCDRESPVHKVRASQYQIPALNVSARILNEPLNRDEAIRFKGLLLAHEASAMKDVRSRKELHENRPVLDRAKGRLAAIIAG